ncbi:MAG: OmpA family protein [Gallionella sp.]|nr:OmpA family protein [Gallionella sp.]MDD4962556.1 OmpA family protein [Gallionella sp.]
MKKIVISGLLLSLLAACAPNPPKPVPPVDTSAADAAAKKAAEEEAARKAAQKAADEAAAKKAADEAAAAAKKAADEAAARNMLPKEATSVYYPFDVDAIQDADKPAVQAHAKYLADHANVKMHVEGNADERGSNEYNLSLGQRRADGVKKMLELGGAKSDQVDAASLGEEKPKAVGHNEEAWSQNRRSDMIYK